MYLETFFGSKPGLGRSSAAKRVNSPLSVCEAVFFELFACCHGKCSRDAAALLVESCWMMYCGVECEGMVLVMHM